MIPLLGRYFMFDDLPPEDRVVCTVLDYIGLGFLLVVSEILFVTGAPWWKWLLSVAAGVFFVWMAHYWPKIKSKIWPSFASLIIRIANNFWLRRIGTVIVLGYLVTMVLSFALSIRRDVDARVMPRQISKEQSQRLHDSLSHHSFAVGVKVVQGDPEAMEYAAQIFNILRGTDLDVNPPNHGGQRI